MEQRPPVTFFIAFYNQERFVKDAIDGALSQDYENLEIVLSDDCSTDNTYQVMTDYVKDYKGPHKLILKKNEHNIGIAAHFNKAAYEYCNGKYLVVGGGDDVSLPHRVSTIVGFMEEHPEVMSMTTLSEQVDINLKPIERMNDYLSEGYCSVYTLDDYCRFKDFMLFSGDSRIYRKSFIEMFPPLSDAREEDLEMFVRSLLAGAVAVKRDVAVKRRIHGNNVSKRASSVKAREQQRQQLLNDAEYALKHNYIKDVEFEAVKKKIELITKTFISVDNRRRHPHLTKLLHGFSSLFEKLAYKLCQK